MFEPHKILQYLMNQAGLRLDHGKIKAYWEHLDAVNNSWAKQVNDHSLIPNPGFAQGF